MCAFYKVRGGGRGLNLFAEKLMGNEKKLETKNVNPLVENDVLKRVEEERDEALAQLRRAEGRLAELETLRETMAHRLDTAIETLEQVISTDDHDESEVKT